MTDNWESPPANKEFFAPDILFPQNGKVLELQKLEAFKQRWVYDRKFQPPQLMQYGCKSCRKFKK